MIFSNLNESMALCFVIILTSQLTLFPLVNIMKKVSLWVLASCHWQTMWMKGQKARGMAMLTEESIVCCLLVFQVICFPESFIFHHLSLFLPILNDSDSYSTFLLHVLRPPNTDALAT